MALEGGKYDELATMVRDVASARGVCVVVQAGKRGNGYAQTIMATSNLDAAERLETMAATLREVAHAMEVEANLLRHNDARDKE